MKAIVITFHGEISFSAGKHDEVDGLFGIKIPFVSVSVWSKDAYAILMRATERTYHNKEFIVKDSAEWYEKFNAAIEEYKNTQEERYKSDLRIARDAINKHQKELNDLENENRSLRKVIKICADSEDILAKFERVS